MRHQRADRARRERRRQRAPLMFPSPPLRRSGDPRRVSGAAPGCPPGSWYNSRNCRPARAGSASGVLMMSCCVRRSCLGRCLPHRRAGPRFRSRSCASPSSGRTPSWSQARAGDWAAPAAGARPDVDSAWRSSAMLTSRLPKGRRIANQWARQPQDRTATTKPRRDYPGLIFQALFPGRVF